LYDKEKVDLERVELGDVFKLLQATEEGLTGEQATERLGIFGPNKLESEEQNAFLQVIVIEACAFGSLADDCN
jgi:H+-transporting ATPase